MTIRTLHCIARMNAGGTATLLDGLMGEMDESIEQLLIYGRCEGGEIDWMAGREVSYQAKYVDSLARSINPIRDLRAFLTVRRIVREFKPDVIHTHTFKAGVIGRAVGLTLWPRPKLVHTFHGHLLTGYFSQGITGTITLLERCFARFSDVLLTVGPQVTADLLQAGVGKSEQFRTILPGVAQPKMVNKEEAKEALGLNRDLFTVGFVGRLTQIKRVDRFLQALALLNSPYQAFVAGDGEELDSAIQEATSASVNVTFLGWRDDIDNVFCAADVIVLTSDNEGFGLVLGEAQLRGTPVIATDVGSVSAALKDKETGYLVPQLPGEIAKAISAIEELGPKEYLDLSVRARVFAEETFSMKRFAGQHAELYRELTSAAR